ERDAAVHAARALLLQLGFGERKLVLDEVAYPLLNGSLRPVDPVDLEEAADLTHCSAGPPPWPPPRSAPPRPARGRRAALPRRHAPPPPRRPRAGPPRPRERPPDGRRRRDRARADRPRPDPSRRGCRARRSPP